MAMEEELELAQTRSGRNLAYRLLDRPWRSNGVLLNVTDSQGDQTKNDPRPLVISAKLQVPTLGYYKWGRARGQ